MKPAAPKTAQAVHETLYDGVDLVVTFEDGRPSQTIKVRKIPRKELLGLATCLARDEMEAAFYMGRDVEFAEALSDDSFVAVMREGRRLNFTRLGSWFELQTQKMQTMNLDPQAEEKLSPLIQKLLGSSMSS